MSRGGKSFTPCADQARLFPAVSGNTINGLGETARRPPTPVYWHSPAKLAHGELQKWMIERTNRMVPETAEMMTGLGGRGPGERVSKAAAPAEGTAEGWSERVKDFALANESDLVGIARLDPDWVFEGYDVAYPWIVVLALEMDHGRLATAPEPPSVIEVMRQYNRGTRAARALADWILAQGYDALPHGGPQGGPVLMVPAALASGFGELGKHGSIINRRYGSSFRLACVLTDMPLVADAPDEFGADDFCRNCKLCTAACPPAAIFQAKQTVRGRTKWFVDFDKCVGYFNETYGCGICIAVCPWSRPGVAPKLAEKMSRRRERN